MATSKLDFSDAFRELCTRTSDITVSLANKIISDVTERLYCVAAELWCKVLKISGAIEIALGSSSAVAK